jgi:hypothetical protein
LILLEIIPGKGLGELRFGMTSQAAEHILGEAPESKFEDDGPDSYGLLAYRDRGIFLHFDQAEDFRLCTIEVQSRPGFILFGQPLFPRNEEEVMSLLKRGTTPAGLEGVKETDMPNIGERSIFVPSLAGTFYFDESGQLQSFQWETFTDAHDERIWPTL